MKNLFKGDKTMLKYAIIGFGGLGKVHYRAYAQVKEKACVDVKLVAICDIRESVFKTQTATNLGDSNASLDFSDYNLYDNVDTLLEKEELDFVVTALPTYLHAEIANKILNRGIHVFSEKPMAISLEEAQSMIDTAKKNNKKLMIGQCCRYTNRYKKLKEIIDSGKYGKVVRADFKRISPLPIWSWENWFLDEKKSGGAILDLHVHDVDLINYYFGMPKSVISFGTNYKTKHDGVVTSYEYSDKIVTCTGEWGLPSYTYPFQSGFFVKMEQATVETKDGKFMLYPEGPDGTQAEEIEVEKNNDYADEVIDFIDCIANDKDSVINPPEESLNSVRIAFAEKLSVDTGEKVVL